MLKTDHKLSVYHNEIDVLMNSTAQPDAPIVIDTHFDRFQPPINQIEMKKNMIIFKE